MVAAGALLCVAGAVGLLPALHSPLKTNAGFQSRCPDTTMQLGRRALTASAATMLVFTCTTAVAETAAAPLTPSQMLTAGEYIREIREARRGFDEIVPLLELQEPRGFEAARIAIRKPPISGIRKPCTKLIALLEEGSIKKSREAKYEAIKKGLERLDGGCRPDADRTVIDVVQEVRTLQENLDMFTQGLGYE